MICVTACVWAIKGEDKQQAGCIWGFEVLLGLYPKEGPMDQPPLVVDLLEEALFGNKVLLLPVDPRPPATKGRSETTASPLSSLVSFLLILSSSFHSSWAADYLFFAHSSRSEQAASKKGVSSYLRYMWKA
jgi:hypothetical protein